MQYKKENNQELEKEWQKSLHFFDELLRKNKLPTDKIWISLKNQWLVNRSELSEEQSTIAGVSQKEIESHLFLNLENHPSEKDIKHAYNSLLRDSIHHECHWIMFYVVTVYNGKTVCALLPLWDFFDQTENTHNYHVSSDGTHVFCLDEIRSSDEMSYISDPDKWIEIKKLPIKLSYLDYLLTHYNMVK